MDSRCAMSFCGTSPQVLVKVTKCCIVVSSTINHFQRPFRMASWITADLINGKSIASQVWNWISDGYDAINDICVIKVTIDCLTWEWEDTTLLILLFVFINMTHGQPQPDVSNSSRSVGENLLSQTHRRTAVVTLSDNLFFLSTQCWQVVLGRLHICNWSMNIL